MAQYKTGDNFAQAVCDVLGVDASTVTRVIIEVRAGHPVYVYVQHNATDKLDAIDLKDLLDGAVLARPVEK